MNFLLMLWFASLAPPRQQVPFKPVNARDSTIMVVQDVGQRVADVRSNLDHLRMLLVTDSLASGAHTQAADALKSACDSLTRVARDERRLMCTRCMPGSMQGAFNGYRDFLPALAAMSRRCAERLGRVDVPDATAAVKRAMALDLSTILVTGLRPYERHVSAVIAAMRAPAGPAGRRAARRP